MADTATAPAEGTETSQGDGRPTGLQNYVRDAIRSAGMKVADLSDEQRERAVSAPDVKGGLRGKDLGTYILEGESGLESARNKAKADKPKATRKPRAASNRYPEWVPTAVARGRHLSGQKENSGGDETLAYAGPIQHMKVRKLIAKEINPSVDEKAGEANGWLDGVTKEKILEAAECKSAKALRDIATFKAGRDAMRPLRPLGAKFGNDGWAKGRFLAAVLVVWMEDLDKAAKAAS
jgi:hypothetical protein